MSTAPTLTYCSWDGDPAVLARFPNGHIRGFVSYDGESWVEGEDAEIATKAAVLPKAQFDAMFPGLALPTALT